MSTPSTNGPQHSVDGDKKVPLILETLEEFKARDVVSRDVRSLTGWFDTLIIASAGSTRHAHTLAQKCVDMLKENGYGKPSLEGEDEGQWIVIDAHSVVAHIMQEETRDLYRLEHLWHPSFARSEQS